MITSINNNSLSFQALRGRDYQTFSKKQESIVNYIENKLSTPIRKNGSKTYMQELESKGYDVYVKPTNNEDEISAALVKYKNNKLWNITFLGNFDSDKKNLFADKALVKQREEDGSIKPSRILLGIAAIAGIMASLYLLPAKNNNQSVEKVIDTMTINKPDTTQFSKDTLKLF